MTQHQGLPGCLVCFRLTQQIEGITRLKTPLGVTLATAGIAAAMPGYDLRLGREYP